MNEKHKCKKRSSKKITKVSVFMVTYNHEKFISQAIESVMMQKTSFPFELVIGEDCSTDNTRNICLYYKNKFPDKIKLFLSDKNLGVKENCKQTLSYCDGDYVAWLEGDDYWIDENKLQLQVEFLEKNNEYALCFHREAIVDEKNKEMEDKWKRKIKAVSSIKDICRGNFICSNTVVFRNYNKFIQTFSIDSVILDWPLWVILADKGKIGFIDKTMSAYRVHGGGIFSMKSKIYQYDLAEKVAHEWKKNIGPKKCNKEFAEIVWMYYAKIIKAYLKEGEYKKMFKYIKKGITFFLDYPLSSPIALTKHFINKVFFYIQKLG